MPISEKALLEKIDKIARDCSKLDQFPMSLFKNHVEEIKREVVTRLMDLASTTDPVLKKQYFLFSWLSVWLLSDQAEKFTLVQASTSNALWDDLNMVIDDLVNRLGLSSKPLPFFGSSFYCTGSFAYTERGIPVSPFYQVSTESYESILFWPLLAHEIAHLKLNETEEVNSLRRELTRRNLRDEKYRERLDESLCDIIATRLYGPSYITSFGTKFWQVLDSYHDESYPSNQFRLFTMFKVTEEMNLGPLLSSIRNTFQVDERLAKREEISFLIHEMIELGKRLVRSPADINDAKLLDFCNNPSTIDRGRLDYLFNTLWLMIYQGVKTFNATTDTARTILERWSKRSKSTT
jgi:hypothetical protein